MPGPKLTKLELQIMETLWTKGEASIREVQEAFPEKGRPAYTTVQTTVYRLEQRTARWLLPSKRSRHRLVAHFPVQPLN